MTSRMGPVAATAFAIGSFLAAPALAAERIGIAHNWQLGFQPPASTVMDEIEGFHNSLLLPLTVLISVFVLGLLVYVAVRFNARSNPVPSKNTHNTLVEVVWTVVPVVILIVIAIPSFRLLFHEGRIPQADLTLKVTGHIWNWEYEYPDQQISGLSANRVDDNALKPGEPRLLTTDHQVVVPVGKVVHVLVTSADVIHAWAVPALGVKVDAVKGRLNSTWFKAEREGIFYGQCSELCGRDHAFMPIQLRVVSEDLFKQWVAAAQQDFDKAEQLLASADAAVAVASVQQER